MNVRLTKEVERLDPGLSKSPRSPGKAGFSARASTQRPVKIASASW